MRTSIALLRGINVSGKNTIIMRELKELFVSEGMENVITYIQSGNVIFDHELNSSRKLEEKLEKAIKNRFGLEVTVIIQTAGEIAEAIDRIPFSEFDEKMLYMTFLKDSPDKVSATQLSGIVMNGDEVRIIDRCAYLLIRNGYGKTKLSNTFIEKKLDVAATTRNLKTVMRLKELAHQED
jgi:uncharacterized protein (DUF1697 family)